MTTWHPNARRLLLSTGALTLVLSGCGGEGSSATTDPTPSAGDASKASQSASEPTSSTSSAPLKSPKPPKSADAADATVKVTIKGSDVSPIAESVNVGVGETLVLDITSDRAGEFHVHSTPEQQLAFKAGTSTVEVIVEQPGQVDIEEHESGALIVRMLVR